MSSGPNFTIQKFKTIKPPSKKSKFKQKKKSNEKLKDQLQNEDELQGYLAESDARKVSLKPQIISFLQDIKNRTDPRETIRILERRLYGQKLFLNMVVHDLRSPSESIQSGLEHVLQI